MYSYNGTQDFLYDPTRLEIHFLLRREDDLMSNCGHKFKKTVSFDDLLQPHC